MSAPSEHGAGRSAAMKEKVNTALLHEIGNKIVLLFYFILFFFMKIVVQNLGIHGYSER